VVILIYHYTNSKSA